MKRLAGLIIAACFVTSAVAVPVEYSMTFDGSIANDPGTGRFYWDDASLTMTGLSWDFGGGRAWGVFDGDIAPYSLQVFDLLTIPGQEDPRLGLPPGYVIGSIAQTSSDKGWRFDWERGTNRVKYGVYDNVDGFGGFSGYVITAPASVPEPTTLPLLALGLAGLGVMTRRETA
jgi:hypothetical protein